MDGSRRAFDGHPIKFEIVQEGRIVLEQPGADDEVCGVACLTPLDMAAGKLLAHSDRGLDDGVFSRAPAPGAALNRLGSSG